MAVTNTDRPVLPRHDYDDVVWRNAIKAAEVAAERLLDAQRATRTKDWRVEQVLHNRHLLQLKSLKAKIDAVVM